MKLYKVISGNIKQSKIEPTITPDGIQYQSDFHPDFETIRDLVDLQLNEVHLVKISQSLKKFCPEFINKFPRTLNSNDVFALKEKGRTIMYRESDQVIHWIIDLDHPNYIPLNRDLKLNTLIS